MLHWLADVQNQHLSDTRYGACGARWMELVADKLGGGGAEIHDSDLHRHAGWNFSRTSSAALSNSWLGIMQSCNKQTANLARNNEVTCPGRENFALLKTRLALAEN
jgi:hypothetical protein